MTIYCHYQDPNSYLHENLNFKIQPRITTTWFVFDILYNFPSGGPDLSFSILIMKYKFFNQRIC